jgi:hypothetical protein
LDAHIGTCRTELRKPGVGSTPTSGATEASFGNRLSVLATAALFTAFCVIAAAMGYAYVHLWT